MDLRGMRFRNLRLVDCEVGAELFAEARGRNAALAKHESLRSVLAALEDWTPELYPERDELTRALIAEARRGGQPFWLAAVQLAYFPMLCHLRSRIRGNALVGNEIDQVVMASFLDALRALPMGLEVDRLSMRLRQGTQRRVFRILRDEQRYQERFFLRDPQDITWLAEQAYPPEGEDPSEHKWRCLWPETAPTPTPPLDEEEQAQQVMFLRKHARGALRPDVLGLVIATLVYGEKVVDIARRMSRGASEEEQQRTYQRLKRRHSRAMDKLRVALAHLLPEGERTWRTRYPVGASSKDGPAPRCEGEPSLAAQ